MPPFTNHLQLSPCPEIISDFMAIWSKCVVGGMRGQPCGSHSMPWLPIWPYQLAGCQNPVGRPQAQPPPVPTGPPTNPAQYDCHHPNPALYHLTTHNLYTTTIQPLTIGIPNTGSRLHPMYIMYSALSNCSIQVLLFSQSLSFGLTSHFLCSVT